MENTMEMAIEAHYKALEHSYAMLEQYNNAKLEYEKNNLVMGPLYWELYTKFREAEAASEAAKVAELAAEKAISDAEAAEKAHNDAENAQYQKEWEEWCMNHKCTFCGELGWLGCGGDHSEEMREISRESERRY